MHYLGEYTHLLVPVTGMLIAYLIVIRAIPIIRMIIHRKKLLEIPDGHRKIHDEPIPSLGGVAIFASVLITFAIMAIWTDTWPLYPFLIGGLCMLFFSGLKDDLLVINARKKLLIQLLAPALVVVGGGVYIDSFGGLFGINSLPVWIAIPFTLYIFVVIVNAYNLIDGIDGLAGGIGVIIALFLGGWFIAADLMPHAVLAFILAGALIGFLRFNWQPATIFMGDTGSLVVGFIIATLTVKMLQTGLANPGAPFHTIMPVIAMALLAIPLYDTLRVFILRIRRGESPFNSGTDHIHHQLLGISGCHGKTAIYLFAANILVLLFVIAFKSLPLTLLFMLTLGFTLMLLPTAGIKRKLLVKLGIFTLNPKPANGSNGSNGHIKLVNGFSPRKLKLPQWEIPEELEHFDLEALTGNNGDGEKEGEKVIGER